MSGSAFLQYGFAGLPRELVCPLPTMGSAGTLEDSPVIVVWGFMTRLGEQQQPITSLPSVRLVGDADSTLTIDRFEAVHANFYTCEVNVPLTSERYFYVFQVYLAGELSALHLSNHSSPARISFKLIRWRCYSSSASISWTSPILSSFVCLL